MGATFEVDRLVFGPGDVDLARSPLRASLNAETFILGAFNPGLARLPNGNLVLMVRVAEALRPPAPDAPMQAIRWAGPGRYVLDAYPRASVETNDPRTFRLREGGPALAALTSLSWLLPVEVSPDGLHIVAVHYDKAIAPEAGYQHYGIEDARISMIEGRYWMTTCSVSAERLCTTLYTSVDGLTYTPHGPVLDHQNKDMLYFEGKVGGLFYALTRPLGEVYFAYPRESPWRGGPSINLAASPDGLHWRPLPDPFIRPRKDAAFAARIGGGAPPVCTESGDWLILYHGVAANARVGAYATFWALAEGRAPWRLLHVADETPLLKAAPALTAPLEAEGKMYLSDIVFTTGIVDAGEAYIVASGEADLACRITHVPKAAFAR